MVNEKSTTIVVSDETKKRLGECGTTNETYEDVIIRLIDLHNKQKQKKV